MTPTTTATSDDAAAPPTPSGMPVPQPKMSTGASAMLSTTVLDCTTMPGLKSPMPRSAAASATIANCSAIAGTNHHRNWRTSAAVAASAAKAAA